MTAAQGMMDWMKNASVAGSLIRGSRRVGSRAFAMGTGMMAGDAAVRAAARGGLRQGMGMMRGAALKGMGIGMGANVAMRIVGNARNGDSPLSGVGGAAITGGLMGGALGGLGFGARRLGRQGSSFWGGMSGNSAFSGHMGAVGPMLGRFGMGI
jgi:hypothetical protein